MSDSAPGAVSGLSGAVSSLSEVTNDAETAEQRADAAADLKVVLLVFCAAVAIAVVYISGWSPQF